MSELSLHSLLWRRELCSFDELLEEEFGEGGDAAAAAAAADDGGGSSSSSSRFVRVRCLRDGCGCGVSNQEAQLLAVARNVRIVSGSWTKLKPPLPGAKASASGASSAAKVSLTDSCSGWFDLLNENGASVPACGSVKELLRLRPISVLLRRSQRCLVQRGAPPDGADVGGDCAEVAKAGTLLTFEEVGRFRVAKSRRTKEAQLAKFRNESGHSVFLQLNDKCSASVVAGAGSVGGVHTAKSLLQTFRFPVSVRPVLGPPLPWLAASERRCLRLSGCCRGHLLFLANAASPDRLFVLTPQAMQHHAVSVGDSELPRHSQLLQRHSARARQFLQSYHPHEAVRYLLRQLCDVTNQQQQQQQQQQQPEAKQQQQQQQQHNELDDLLDEVEDIYHFVRTGKMPKARRPTSSMDSGLGGAGSSRRTASCQDLLLQENREPSPPPPLPPRKYMYNSPVVRHRDKRPAHAQQQQIVRAQSRSSANLYFANGSGFL